MLERAQGRWVEDRQRGPGRDPPRRRFPPMSPPKWMSAFVSADAGMCLQDLLRSGDVACLLADDLLVALPSGVGGAGGGTPCQKTREAPDTWKRWHGCRPGMSTVGE